jgi:hypothetical protein
MLPPVHLLDVVSICPRPHRCIHQQRARPRIHQLRARPRIHPLRALRLHSTAQHSHVHPQSIS